MEPVEVRFPIQQGAPAMLHFRWIAAGVPAVLTGYQANWEIWDPKRRIKYAEIAVDFPDRNDGQIRGRLTAAQTLLIPAKAGKAVHDLHLFPSTGDSFYLLYGPADASFRVSRDTP